MVISRIACGVITKLLMDIESITRRFQDQRCPRKVQDAKEAEYAGYRR